MDGVGPVQRRSVAQDIFGLEGKELTEKYRVDRVVEEGGFGVVYRAV